LDYVSDIFCHKYKVSVVGRWSLVVSFRRSLLIGLYCAAAPLTISIISLVILAWRARFMIKVSESIMSLALMVAASMAVMRARVRRLPILITHGKSGCRYIWAKFRGTIRPAAARRCNRLARSELGGCLVDGSGVGWPDADARRLGCFQSLLALLFRSFLRHVDIDFADFLDGQHTLGHQALRDTDLNSLNRI